MHARVQILPSFSKVSKAAILALKATAEKMRADIIREQVIPFDTGNLQNVATYVSEREAEKGAVKIIHDTPYARRLYYHPEYNFSKLNNPNARGEWWESWLQYNGVNSSLPFKYYKHYLKKASGGTIK